MLHAKKLVLLANACDPGMVARDAGMVKHQVVVGTAAYGQGRLLAQVYLLGNLDRFLWNSDHG